MKFLSFLKSNKEKGASMVEYVVLVALIALAVLLVVGTLGGQINDVFNAIINSLSTVPGVS